MENLFNTSKIVKYVMEQLPDTRNSDDLLYFHVCGIINRTALSLSFCEVILHRKELGLPSYKSVERSRRKIQKMHPELAGSTEIEAHRNVNEEIVKEFVRS